MKKSTAPSVVRTNGTRLNGDKDAELKQLLAALTAFKRGDFSVRLPEEWTGISGKVADTFNEVIALNFVTHRVSSCCTTSSSMNRRTVKRLVARALAEVAQPDEYFAVLKTNGRGVITVTE